MLYLASGPGGSTEPYIFLDSGPCTFRENETEPSLKPHSFNEYANMLYIDQPIATGFFHGRNPINSTCEAAEYIWKFLQAFLADFEEYKDLEFGILGNSHGGHTAPALVTTIPEKKLDTDKSNQSVTLINPACKMSLTRWDG